MSLQRRVTVSHVTMSYVTVSHVTMIPQRHVSLRHVTTPVIVSCYNKKTVNITKVYPQSLTELSISQRLYETDILKQARKVETEN